MPRGVKNLKSIDGIEVKQSRSPNWNQADTDLLCNIVRQLGLKSVLNKKTNGTTSEIKKADWIKITERFNSHSLVSFK